MIFGFLFSCAVAASVNPVEIRWAQTEDKIFLKFQTVELFKEAFISNTHITLINDEHIFVTELRDEVKPIRVKLSSIDFGLSLIKDMKVVWDRLTQREGLNWVKRDFRMGNKNLEPEDPDVFLENNTYSIEPFSWADYNDWINQFHHLSSPTGVFAVYLRLPNCISCRHTDETYKASSQGLSYFNASYEWYKANRLVFQKTKYTVLDPRDKKIFVNHFGPRCSGSSCEILLFKSPQEPVIILRDMLNEESILREVHRLSPPNFHVINSLSDLVPFQNDIMFLWFECGVDGCSSEDIKNLDKSDGFIPAHFNDKVISRHKQKLLKDDSKVDQHEHVSTFTDHLDANIWRYATTHLHGIVKYGRVVCSAEDLNMDIRKGTNLVLYNIHDKIVREFNIDWRAKEKIVVDERLKLLKLAKRAQDGIDSIDEKTFRDATLRHIRIEFHTETLQEVIDSSEIKLPLNSIVPRFRGDIGIINKHNYLTSHCSHTDMNIKDISSDFKVVTGEFRKVPLPYLYEVDDIPREIATFIHHHSVKLLEPFDWSIEHKYDMIGLPITKVFYDDEDVNGLPPKLYDVLRSVALHFEGRVAFVLAKKSRFAYEMPEYKLERDTFPALGLATGNEQKAAKYRIEIPGNHNLISNPENAKSHLIDDIEHILQNPSRRVFHSAPLTAMHEDWKHHEVKEYVWDTLSEDLGKVPILLELYSRWRRTNTDMILQYKGVAEALNIASNRESIPVIIGRIDILDNYYPVELFNNKLRHDIDTHIFFINTDKTIKEMKLNPPNPERMCRFLAKYLSVFQIADIDAETLVNSIPDYAKAVGPQPVSSQIERDFHNEL